MKRNKTAKEPVVPASTAENTVENGFYEVIYNDRRGYALTQYLGYCVVETSLKGGWEMRKQKLTTVVPVVGVVLDAAVFVGYESTRYTRTMQAAEQGWQPGDTEEAIPIYEKTIRMRPKWTEAYLALTEIYERNKRHVDAVSLLKTTGEAMSGRTSRDAMLIREALERYSPTVKASLESDSYENPAEFELTNRGVSIRYTLLEASVGGSAEEQDYEKPPRFRRDETYRLQRYAVNQKREAGELVELSYAIQPDPEKYHTNSWHQKDNGQYYSDDTGVSVVGWRQVDDNWYHFTEGGEMVTGWLGLDDNFYYLDKNGVIANGWRNLDGKYYYFLEGGSMAMSRRVDGDYCVGVDGVMLVSTTTPGDYQLDGDDKKIEKSQNEKTVKTYRNTLLDRSQNGRKLPGGQFAVVDIDGNGVWRLLTKLDTGGYDDAISRIFYYTNHLNQYVLDGGGAWDYLMLSSHRIIIGRTRGKNSTHVLGVGSDGNLMVYDDSDIFWGYYEDAADWVGSGQAESMSQTVEKHYRNACYNIRFADIAESNVAQYLSGNGQETGTSFAADNYLFR